MLKVAVTDPDNPDYPGIPDGARQWRLEQQRPGIPDGARQWRLEQQRTAYLNQ